MTNDISRRTLKAFVGVVLLACFAPPSPARSRTPAGCPKSVIYVSDFNANVVDIFPLAGTRQRRCGQITGFSQPNGLAVDLQGNLYVANTDRSQILKFAPGAVAPSLKIYEPGQFPVAVSVNASGIIAVTNIFSAGKQPGSLAIFNPDGSRVGIFRDPNPNFFLERDCKIAPNGDTYTTGSDKGFTVSHVNVFKAPAYAATDLNITLHRAAGIDLVGNDLFVGDEADPTKRGSASISEYDATGHRIQRFALAQSVDLSAFEIASVSGGTLLYTADLQAYQAQEYAFGNSNAINAIAFGNNPSGTPTGIAITPRLLTTRSSRTLTRSAHGNAVVPMRKVPVAAVLPSTHAAYSSYASSMK